AGTEAQSSSEGAAMPAPRMRFHPLAPEAKCPACGASLTFVRVRGYGDLYSCASGGPCKCPVIQYRSKVTKTCGFALIYSSGAFGKWTACAGTLGKGEGCRPYNGVAAAPRQRRRGRWVQRRREHRERPARPGAAPVRKPFTFLHNSDANATGD